VSFGKMQSADKGKKLNLPLQNGFTKACGALGNALRVLKDEVSCLGKYGIS